MFNCFEKEIPEKLNINYLALNSANISIQRAFLLKEENMDNTEEMEDQKISENKEELNISNNIPVSNFETSKDFFNADKNYRINTNCNEEGIEEEQKEEQIKEMNNFGVGVKSLMKNYFDDDNINNNYESKSIMINEIKLNKTNNDNNVNDDIINFNSMNHY